VARIKEIIHLGCIEEILEIRSYIEIMAYHTKIYKIIFYFY